MVRVRGEDQTRYLFFNMPTNVIRSGPVVLGTHGEAGPGAETGKGAPQR